MSAVSILKKVLEPIVFSLRTLKGRLIKHIAGRNIYGFVAETPEGFFIVEPTDQSVGKALLNKGVYGKNEIERIKKLVSSIDDVLVVGAHIGALALPVSSFVNSVTAIEASPVNYSMLCRNILINSIKNITPVNIAASDRKESLDFVVNTTNSGGSKRMPLVKSYKYFYDNPSVIKVAADRLDDILGDKKFKLVFMDIEGSEFFALKGMPDILEKAEVLIIEFLPHHLKNVAGITPEEFLSVIPEKFSKIYIPSKDLTAERSSFKSVLRQMYDKGEGDDGIIFTLI